MCLKLETVLNSSNAVSAIEDYEVSFDDFWLKS